MTNTVLLAIDQGTTSSRAIVFDTVGGIQALAQAELALHIPRSGWIEQSTADIWEDTLAVTRDALAKAQEQKLSVAGIGITNQRETTIVWDRHTGHAVYNAIVWQDSRTAGLCDDLHARGHEDMIADKTGLRLSPYFSATKIAWILDHIDGARERAKRGDLLFGTVDSYLLWNLTGGVDGGVHVTDATNASRTMIFNIITQDWDDELLALFNIPRAMLPDVRDTVADFGNTAEGLLPQSLPIAAMVGDQQGSLAGHGCFVAGSLKSTYGTGCFALQHIGDSFKRSDHKLLTTVAARLNGKVSYALEGSVFVAGSAVQWLRDGLGAIDAAADSEALALSVPDNNDVYFVPALVGLGAPHWAPEATGLITGLRRDSTQAHIVRAALEAQAYQTYDLIKAMEADSGYWPEAIRVDGGLVANGFVCQFLADILDMRVEVPAVSECTAWGAAALAGVQLGVFKNLDQLVTAQQDVSIYTPAMESKTRDALIAGWQKAVKKTLS